MVGCTISTPDAATRARNRLPGDCDGEDGLPSAMVMDGSRTRSVVEAWVEQLHCSYFFAQPGAELWHAFQDVDDYLSVSDPALLGEPQNRHVLAHQLTTARQKCRPRRGIANDVTMPLSSPSPKDKTQATGGFGLLLLG